jgi:PPOX class probable F420-dependent enzyme
MTRAMIAIITLAGVVVTGACAPAPAQPPAPTPASQPAPSQPPAPGASPAAPARDEVLAAARDLITRTPFATMVTVDETGAPQSRIVDPFPLEDGFVAWIATTGASRKVAHITREPRVALTYFDAERPGYVTLTGTAAVVRDPAEKSKRWKDSWVGFYKDKNRGDDYTLIRVTPTTLEISSPSHKMANDPATWKPVTVILKSGN